MNEIENYQISETESSSDETESSKSFRHQVDYNYILLQEDEENIKTDFTGFIMRLLKDKQLRRFAFELIKRENVLQSKDITATLMVNPEGHYRLLLKKGNKLYDYHPSLPFDNKWILKKPQNKI